MCVSVCVFYVFHVCGVCPAGRVGERQTGATAAAHRPVREDSQWSGQGPQRGCG